MIAELLIDIAANQQRKEQAFRFRPSSSGRCSRALAYQGLGYPRKALPGRAVLVLDDSTFHEDQTIKWLKKSGYEVFGEQLELECGVVNGVTIKGHIDWLIKDLAGKITLVEHKAINHFTFERYVSGAIKPMDYFQQCCFYIKGLQNQFGEFNNEAILLVKNKNTSSYLEYKLYYDVENDMCIISHMTKVTGEIVKMDWIIKDILGDVIHKFEWADDCIKNKALPMRGFTLDDWQCSYCAYKETCYLNYTEEVAGLKEGLVIAEQEVMDKIYRLQDYSERRLDLEKEEKGLKKYFMQLLIDKKVQSAICGGWQLERKVTIRKKLNKDLLKPETMRDMEAAKEDSMSESVKIKFIK